MRIAFISQYFYPEPFSNTSIARSMVKRGHDVSVLTAVPNYPKGIFYDGYSNREKRHEIWKGIEIERVRTYPRKNGKVSLILNYLTFVIAGSWAALFLRMKKPDIVFVSQLSPVLMGIPAILLARRFKVPIVLWVQDIWPESAIFNLNLKSPLIVKPLTWISGWIYRQANYVLVQSAAFPPMITRFGIDESKIHIFPNTAPDSYCPMEASEAPEQAKLVPQDGFLIMFAGNIGASQDFDTIIDTAKILKPSAEIQWIIIGDGRDFSRVKKRVETEGLSDLFHFLGRHPEHTMPYFFAHADALLVTLKKTPIYALTVPYKVQCYMACAKPIIAALDGEGARVIQEAKAGISAPSQAPKALAEAILSLIEQSDEARQKIGQNARSYFEENYKPNVVYSKLDQWMIQASNWEL